MPGIMKKYWTRKGELSFAGGCMKVDLGIRTEVVIDAVPGRTNIST